VSIAGAGQTNTIIDGNATDRVFEIQPGVIAEISGVTIQNGNSTSSFAGSGGGGLVVDHGTLTLTNSTVSGNTTSHAHGGGIAVYFGTLTLTNSTVSDNTARYYGGGITNSRDAIVTLTNSTVSGNAADYGGGGIAGSDFTLTNSTVSGNTTIYSGGGIFGWDFTLTNSTLSGNTARYNGGGIFGSYFTLTNSTVSGNTASYGGGGGLWGGFFSLTNSTVSGNTAYYGGGIEVYNGTSTLTNTIVADNAVDNCKGSVVSLNYNLTDDTSCGFTEPSDLVVADAMLGPLQDNGGPTETHNLLPGSPAIDAGSANCPPPATDQRGVLRPQGADCDIGSVEFVPEPRGLVMLVAGAAFLGLLYRRRR
jgi:predicted outer membrane repeat protein